MYGLGKKLSCGGWQLFFYFTILIFLPGEFLYDVR